MTKKIPGSKATFKLYHNERLKKVDFHGFCVHPLYVQTTFGRKSLFFKSAFFDQLYDFRFKSYVDGISSFDFAPIYNDIEEREAELLEYIFNYLLDDFQDLPELYKTFSLNILLPLDYNLREVLYSFLNEKGYSSIADCLMASLGQAFAYNVYTELLQLANAEFVLEIDGYLKEKTPIITLMRYHSNAISCRKCDFLFPYYLWYSSVYAQGLENYLIEHEPEIDYGTLNNQIDKTIKLMLP